MENRAAAVERETILAGIQAVAREHLGRREALTPGLRLVEDLELDSIQLLTLAVEVENRFRICLEPEDEAGIATVGDLVAAVAARLDATPAATPAAGAESARAESADAESVRAEPVNSEPANSEPVNPEPAKAEPAAAEPARAGLPSAEANAEAGAPAAVPVGAPPGSDASRPY